MNFLQPLFLVGLLAAALPLVIHLINRRKAVRRPFPALKLLQESNQRIARSVKLRQWILLALRVLAIALLTLAIAKPYFVSSQGLTANERLPSAVALVIDNGVASDHGNWFDQAKSQARQRLSDLRPWDEVSVFTTADSTPPLARQSSDHSEARQAIDAIEKRYLPGDLAQTLIDAERLLAASQLPNRRIVVIGPNTLSSVRDPNQELSLNVPIEYDSIGATDDLIENLSVHSVSYEQDGATAEPRFRFTAVIENHGAVDATGVRVQLTLGNQVVGGTTLEVPAGKTVQHSFLHRIEAPEPLPARVELVDADPLHADNVHHFLFRPQRQIRALLVNGAPSSNPINDELFYFTRAIEPAQDTGPEILPSITTPDGLTRRDLNDFDVVMLANVATITAAQAQEFQSFVQNGGGLFLAMGEQVDIDSYNTHLADLLPRPLRGVKELASRNDPDAPVKITRMGHPTRQHPIFQVFALPGGGSIQSVQVFSYMLLDPAPADQDTRQLLSYQDNAPALLERQVGQGRVLLFTTSIDRDWTDLPVRSAYLPMVNRSLLYLARRTTSTDDDQRLVGTPITLNVADQVRDRAIIHTPTGDRLVLEPFDGQITLTPQTPGLYTFFADHDTGANQRPVPSLDFAANIDPRASTLAPLPPELLSRWQADSLQPDPNDPDATHPSNERRVNLWSYLLFLVTMALLAETILGSRRSFLVQTLDRLQFWRR